MVFGPDHPKPCQASLSGAPPRAWYNATWAVRRSLRTCRIARDEKHWPAWTAFNKRIGNDGTVGIFHETYAVNAGGYETVYGNMPPFGLGKVAGLVPATGSRNEARSRMRETAQAD